MRETQDEVLLRERIKEIESLSLEYQLGWYVGESIIQTLPTLDIDPIPSRVVIRVSEEERKHYSKLYDEWASKSGTNENSEDAWNAMDEFGKQMVDKYIPETKDFLVRAANVKNEMEFKEGIADALYDSHVCHFKCNDPSDIEFHLHPRAIATVVTLRRKP